MSDIWACITADGVVDNCIVADKTFVDSYLESSSYATILPLEGIDPVPGPGWLYDDDTFTAPPTVEVPAEPVPEPS